MYTGIHHAVFITRDLDRTIRFYRDLLRFPLTSCIGLGDLKLYFFQVGPSDQIAFFAYDEAAPMEYKWPGHRTTKPRGFDHLAIGVATKADLFAARDRLIAAGVEATPAVDHGLEWSVYFHDPNGIPLEFAWSPLRLEKLPVMNDQSPVAAALEGSAPQPGHWPEVQRPSTPAQWQAQPGAGWDSRLIAVRDGARPVEE